MYATVALEEYAFLGPSITKLYFWLLIIPAVSFLFVFFTLTTLACFLYILSCLQIMKTPIICGREPTSSEEEKKLAAERSSELSAIVNQVILVYCCYF